MNKLFEEKIENLPLPKFVISPILRHNHWVRPEMKIIYVKDLKKFCSEKGLLTVRNFGKKGLKTLLDYLKKNGIDIFKVEDWEIENK